MRNLRAANYFPPFKLWFIGKSTTIETNWVDYLFDSNLKIISKPKIEQETSMKKSIAQDDSPLIRHIEVDQLFYTFTYSLELTPTIGDDSGKLMLLYGGNGSGKTTILNLLYHLLNPEPFGGHRSFVGSVPFRLFRVSLLGGIVVSAKRGKSLTGSYTITLKDPSNKQDLDWKWIPGSTKEDDPLYLNYCDALRKLGFSFHYLKDTRRVEGRHAPSNRMVSRRHIENNGQYEIFFDESDEESKHYSPEALLDKSIEAALSWFRTHALTAANIGYTSVNTVYEGIIGRIVNNPSKRRKSLSVEELISSVVELKRRNGDFAALGLTPNFEINEISKYLKMADSKHLSLISTVLEPYLDGHEARLNALSELQLVMSGFVSLLCNFYSHKEVSLHLERGLEFNTKAGQKLSHKNLSSGEKQLLLLFCNAISSRQNRTILMIDEPEISLNVTWQRNLVPALIQCMTGTSYQLILATHSIELLARYRESVTPLDNVLES